VPNDHEPSVFPDACDAAIVPALEVPAHPVSAAVALVLTANVPVELVAAKPVSVVPLE
jgi:hypothetical protein